MRKKKPQLLYNVLLYKNPESIEIIENSYRNYLYLIIKNAGTYMY